MSSVSVFQPYVDKENTGQTGARVKNRDGSVTGLGGKVFQSSGPTFATPRSALRDVNQDLSVGRHGNKDLKPQKPAAPISTLFKKPASDTPSHFKSNKIHKQKSLITTQVEKSHKPVTKKPDPYPEKEILHIWKGEDEVRPKCDLDFTGVIGQLRKWRPACLFVTRPDSDIDTDEEDDNDVLHDDMFHVQPPHIDPFEDDVLIELSAVTDIPDIDIPDIDLPIPFLDDTIDIEPNIGTLQLWDSSTPMSLSPNPKHASVSTDSQHTSCDTPDSIHTSL